MNRDEVTTSASTVITHLETLMNDCSRIYPKVIGQNHFRQQQQIKASFQAGVRS